MFPLGQGYDLVEDLGGGQRLLETLTACCAEAASHAAPGLGRYAERGALPVGDVCRFDEVPLEGAEEVFFRSVGGYRDAFGGREGRGEALGEALSVRCGEVGHPEGVFDVADVEPPCDLPGCESGHGEMLAERCEFFGSFAV